MGLPKGQTNNPNGRPKGSKNKSSAEIREMFSELISNNIEQLQNDLNKLEPKDRIKAMIDFSKFVVPSLRSHSLSGDREQPLFSEPITKIERVIIDSKKGTGTN